MYKYLFYLLKTIPAAWVKRRIEDVKMGTSPEHRKVYLGLRRRKKKDIPDRGG